MSNCRVAVVVASLGRPDDLSALIDRLKRQTYPVAEVVLSVVSQQDLPAQVEGTTIVMGSKGLPAQRNRGLQALGGDLADIVVFYDDDFVPSANAIQDAVALFEAHSDIVGVTGKVLADGIKGAGIPFATAASLVETYDASSSTLRIVRELPDLYGCNMAFRGAAIRGMTFDENLPLYGWQEDVDFSARCARHGRLVLVSGFAGVHRGVKGGRTSGCKFGWSQVVNPLYLARKGTMHPIRALQLVVRNMVANHFGALRPEPWVDRLGRVKGNWAGVAHVLSGRLDPRAVTTIE